MSSDIWTLCAGPSEIAPLRLEPWRVVEAQHRVSTRKLVDTLDEQALLEALIDGAKPPSHAPPWQHYLLTTPFRYPPLRHGSRFGRAHERGLWYGAASVPTALAEVAYYRLVFLEGTTADLGRITVDLTAFRVRARTTRGVDLTVAPFDAHGDIISSRTHYGDAQALGARMREHDVGACRYHSARDPMGGANIVIFTPAAFGRSSPHAFQNWHCLSSTDGVEMTRRDLVARQSLVFSRATFLVDGQLPMPALA